MLRDTLSKILGERADAELAREIKRTVNSFPEVLGSYDLVLHNYGPDAFHGSVHIEVPDTFTADELDRLTRKLTAAVYEKTGVILTAVGVYSSNTKDALAVETRKRVSEIALSHEHVMQIHGFYFDSEEKSIRFDIIVSFDAKDRREVCRQVTADIQKAFPDYRLEIVLDTDFSEG